MKKGFTLIELLAVIAILAIVLLIAVPYVINTINNVKTSTYSKNEALLSKAAANYIVANQTLIPGEIGDITVVNLSDLKTANFITDVIDPKDNSACAGTVVISKKNATTITYSPYLDCGSADYQTYGNYVSNNLVLNLDGYLAPASGYWNDESGNNNHAQLKNMAGTITSGYNPNKKAYVFDGINDYLQVNHNATISTKIYTIEYIVKLNAINPNLMICTKGENWNNTNNYQLWINNYSGSNNQTKVDMSFTDEISLTSISNSGINANLSPINNLIKVAYILSPTSLKLYLNNQLTNNWDITGKSPILNTANLSIMSFNGTNYSINGNLYSFRIYNRALSESELTTNYNIDKQRFGF